MICDNYNSDYNGVYQSNIVFDENFENFVDQENWEEESESIESCNDAFICPGQPEAEA